MFNRSKHSGNVKLFYESANGWGANIRGSAPYLLRRCEIDPRRMREQAGTLSEPNLALRLSGFHPGLR